MATKYNYKMYPCHAPIIPKENLVKKNKDQLKEEYSRDLPGGDIITYFVLSKR